MPTASPVAAPRVSSAKMLTRLLEQSGQHAAGEAAHAFRFQRQDVSHLRSFLTYALGVMSDTGVYEDDIRASLSDCNVSDAASMQQALYKLFCLRGGEGLCTLLLHYVAILSESPADGGGVGPGRKTSGLSATTLEHKVRRLALFVRLQATTTGSTTPTNLLDKHHPVWGKLHAAVHRSHSEESNKAARAAASQQQAQANAAAPWYHDGAVQHGTTMALLAAAQGASAALPPHAGAWFPGLGGPLPPAAVAQLLLYAQHPLLPAHLQHLQHAVLAGAPGLSLPPLGGADGLQATAPGSPYPHPYPLDYPGAHAALYAAAVLPQLPSGAAAEGGHTAALDSDAVLGGSVGSPSAGSCSTGTRGEAAAAATGAAPAAAPVPAAAGSSRPDVKRSRSQADDGLPVAPMPMPMRVAMPAGASDDNGSEDASTQRGKAARLAPGPGTGLGCDSRERVGNGESGPHAAAGGSTFRAIGGGGCEWHSGSTVDAGASAGGAQLPVERANTPPLLVAAAAMALALQQQAARQQKGPGGQEGGCEEVRRTADGGAGSAAGAAVELTPQQAQQAQQQQQQRVSAASHSGPHSGPQQQQQQQAQQQQRLSAATHSGPHSGSQQQQQQQAQQQQRLSAATHSGPHSGLQQQQQQQPAATHSGPQNGPAASHSGPSATPSGGRLFRPIPRSHAATAADAATTQPVLPASLPPVSAGSVAGAARLPPLSSQSQSQQQQQPQQQQPQQPQQQRAAYYQLPAASMGSSTCLVAGASPPPPSCASPAGAPSELLPAATTSGIWAAPPHVSGPSPQPQLLPQPEQPSATPAVCAALPSCIAAAAAAAAAGPTEPGVPGTTGCPAAQTAGALLPCAPSWLSSNTVLAPCSPLAGAGALPPLLPLPMAATAITTGTATAPPPTPTMGEASAAASVEPLPLPTVHQEQLSPAREVEQADVGVQAQL